MIDANGDLKISGMNTENNNGHSRSDAGTDRGDPEPEQVLVEMEVMDPLNQERAITVYCKAHFGWDNPELTGLPSHTLCSSDIRTFS